MPMTWNAEADAKLLNAIIKVYDVKVNGEKMKDVAEIMGPDCTPKAITHRLAKLRTIMNGSAGDGETQEEGGAATTPKAKAGKAAKTAATASKGRAKKGKKAAEERTPSPAEEGEESMVTPPVSGARKGAGAKRKARSASADVAADVAAGADDDEESLSKKVKVEEAEEGDAGAEGEGEVEGENGIADE